MFNFTLPPLVVFDLDDTLYDYERANDQASSALISEFSSLAKVSKEIIAEHLVWARENVKHRLGSTASSHSRMLYISESFRLLKLPPDTGQFLHLEELFWKTFLADIELFPGAKELLELLKDQGISLALVTDLTSSIQYRKLNKLGLNGIFDIILTSEEVGGDKVSELSFRLLEELLGSVTLSTWFFGDSEFDRVQMNRSESIFFKKV
jgi:putative hydrolase of the HAD superfamily